MNPRRFPIVRIYSDEEGESHFQDGYLPLEDAGEIGSLSPRIGEASIFFRGNEPDYDYDWHVAPARQFILMMTGEIEVRVSDGEARRIRPGEALFLEDVRGKGHKTRNVGTTERLSVFVQTDAPVDFRRA